MKRTVTHLLLAAALLGGARALAETKPAAWAELKAYHGVMAATFHPAEDGKLEPIRTRSGELAATAAAWVKSTPPADFNQPAIAAKLKLLATESAALDQLVRSGQVADADLKAALTKLHDRFHEIVGACRDAGQERK